MSDHLLILTPDQKESFAQNGYLLYKGFYDKGEMEEIRSHFHDLLTQTEYRPKNMSYAFMGSPAGYEPDPFNPNNVVGMMDQTLADDYWFDQFTEPRIVAAIVDLLGQRRASSCRLSNARLHDRHDAAQSRRLIWPQKDLQQATDDYFANRQSTRPDHSTARLP